MNIGIHCEPQVTETFWDTLWHEALKTPSPGPHESAWENAIDRRKMRFLTRYLPAEGAVSEVGCGSARLLARVGLTAPALRLVALDESRVALQVAKTTAAAFNVSLRTIRGTIASLPLADASVDMVLSGGLLEHFPEPTPVLAEMVRVLRPGGVIYADVVPRKISWYRAHEAVRMRTSEYMEDGVYESSLGPADYRQRLGGLGCDVVRTCWCGVYPWLAQHRRRLGPLVARASEILDGTPIARRWGWYFMLVAIKRRTPRAARSGQSVRESGPSRR